MLGLAALILPLQLAANPVIFHLSNGDRIAGEVVAEGAETIVVDTPWVKGLIIPRNQIKQREQTGSGTSTRSTQALTAAQTNAPAAAKVQTAVAGTKPGTAKPVDRWRFDAKLGADMIRGERDRDIYYGQVALTYARPYDTNPKKFFRNILDCRVDYGTTDGRESANRLLAANKTDFDIGEHLYAYCNLAGGYDEVRRISSQFEAGPGVGCRLWRGQKFAANAEAGLTYQSQNRDDVEELKSLYARIGQDCTWKVYSKITFTQRSSLLTSVEENDQMQFRLEANLAFGIIQNLSLNLTAVELYDTRPVPGISKNEFQLRSSLGITF